MYVYIYIYIYIYRLLFTNKGPSALPTANNSQGQLQTPQYQYVLVQRPYVIDNARSILFCIVQGGQSVG